jgi:hypothetical protein
MITSSATLGKEGTNHRKISAATAAPSNCAMMKPGATPAGIPARFQLAILSRARQRHGRAKLNMSWEDYAKWVGKKLPPKYRAVSQSAAEMVFARSRNGIAATTPAILIQALTTKTQLAIL